VILAHNYQRPEIQEIADYVGDSLGLSKKAAETPCKIIIFCGVRFMAETAKILSPEKRVLLPRKEAGCPMADMITAESLRKIKKENPEAKVVCYVNTTADIKAESDVCCTSSNALKVVQNIDSERIIFVPDRNLAKYVANFTDKKIVPYNGYCYVHERIRAEDVKKAKEIHPDAKIIVHPECKSEVIQLAEVVTSTEGMARTVKASKEEKFIIGTEEGLLYRLKRENPQKKFFSAGPALMCYNMKLTSLEDVYLSLKEERYEIKVEKEIQKKARRSLERMLDYT